jgi:NDP-sugar pyrophosphorylase family protein
MGTGAGRGRVVIRRAMVLAAGRGTRLAPLTDRLPKPLMPVAGRPMLAHILEFLRAGGIEEVVINLHHLGHLIEDAIGDGRRFGLRVLYSWEPEILDTGGGIKRAESLLAGEPFVVANGDSLIELPLRDVLDYHQRRGGIITIVVRPSPDAARLGLIELDDDDRVRRVVGCPEEPVDVPLRGFMFPGLHVFDPEIFGWMEPGVAFGVIRETYPRLLRAGRPIYGFVAAARWLNIDTPAGLAAAGDVLARDPFRF